MSTVRVELVGPREPMTDHLYGTNIVWDRIGDVHDVPEEAWKKMAAHPDVWKRAGEKAAPAPVDVAPPRMPAPVESMTDPEVHALARDRRYNVHNRLSGENLRKRFVELELADPIVKR